MLNIKGKMLNVLGKNVVVTQGTSYPVERFITSEEYEKRVRKTTSRHHIREMLTTLSGEKIIVNYIKSH